MTSPGVNVRSAATAGRPKYPMLLDEAWTAHPAPRATDAPAVISLFARAGGSSLGYNTDAMTGSNA
jgi:hypothetical protein